MSSTSRDPIKNAPLRDPGQSLGDQFDGVLVDRIMPWLVMASVACVFAIVEWYRYLFSVENSPIFFTVVAAGWVAVAAFRVRRELPQLARLRLGRRGERAVGQFLQDELTRCGYRLLHDVCDTHFNIDHVAIGPGGVFTVETKTISKPTSRDAKVTYDGKQIRIDGRQLDRDPLAQARAAADRIAQILKEYSGQEVSVRPVVVFPGWFVERQPRGVEVWVLNEKALISFVDNEPVRLQIPEIEVLRNALARYVRDFDLKR